MKTPRQRRSAFALGILTALVGSLPTLATPFYTYSIAARTGVDLDGSGFVASSISPRVSLNDSGAVAFIATTAAGRNGVFVAEPAGGGFTIRKLAETSNGKPDPRSRRREEARFDSEFGSRAATAKLAAKEHSAARPQPKRNEPRISRMTRIKTSPHGFLFNPCNLCNPRLRILAKMSDSNELQCKNWSADILSALGGQAGSEGLPIV